jgi:Ca2+-binding EF-hand superfamily protein
MGMKLAAMILASLLALPTAARADEVLHPPGGPVFVEADYPQAGGRAPSPEQRQKNKQLKQALMLQFDRDGDGRLGPDERRKAIRVLARIQRKLAGQGAQGQQRPKMRRFIQRFDTNGDGNVDQSEMPPGAARKLRRMDRDRDGWVEPTEVR